jgi:hypothetical protein
MYCAVDLSWTSTIFTFPTSTNFLLSSALVAISLRTTPVILRRFPHSPNVPDLLVEAWLREPLGHTGVVKARSHQPIDVVFDERNMEFVSQHGRHIDVVKGRLCP